MNEVSQNGSESESEILGIKEAILREESLASWRLAANLTFNGLLINTLFTIDVNHPRSTFIESAAPAIGCMVTMSFLVVSFMSVRVKFYYISQNMRRNNECIKPRLFNYLLNQMLGPYIFCNLMLLVFWLWYFF